MSAPYAGTNTYPATYDIPADGDARTAASVNTGLQALGDRTTYLAARLGSYRMVACDVFDPGAGSGLLCSSGALAWGDGTTGADYAIGDVSVQGQANDVLEVTANPIALRDAAGAIEARLAYKIAAGSLVPSRESRLYITDSAQNLAMPVLMRLVLGGLGTVHLFLQCTDPAASSTVRLYKPCLFIAKLWRPNT